MMDRNPIMPILLSSPVRGDLSLRLLVNQTGPEWVQESTGGGMDKEKLMKL